MKITFISKLNNLQSEYQSNHHKATYSKKTKFKNFHLSKLVYFSIELNNVSEKWDQRATNLSRLKNKHNLS